MSSVEKLIHFVMFSWLGLGFPLLWILLILPFLPQGHTCNIVEACAMIVVVADLQLYVLNSLKSQIDLVNPNGGVRSHLQGSEGGGLLFCFVMILCFYVNYFVLHVMHEIFELLSLFWAWLSPATSESAVREVRGTFVWI